MVFWMHFDMSKAVVESVSLLGRSCEHDSLVMQPDHVINNYVLHVVLSEWTAERGSVTCARLRQINVYEGVCL